MLITKTIRIDMGHRVMNHKSKCKNFHGHSYEIECGVDDQVITTPGVSNEGMVIDYGDLKNVMNKHLDMYDHSLVLSNTDPLAKQLDDLLAGTKLWLINNIPTAENLAKHWYYLFKKDLDELNIKIKHVKVWETPTSTATYEE